MNNIFLEKKEELNLSYGQLGQMFDPPVSRGAVNVFIRQPERSGKDTIIRMATALGIEEQSAIDYWKLKKAEKFNRAAQNKIDNL